MEFHEKTQWKYYIDGDAYAYYFSKISKIYIVRYIIRQENKVHRFISRLNNVKTQKYSKILPDLVILELIALNGW